MENFTYQQHAHEIRKQRAEHLVHAEPQPHCSSNTCPCRAGKGASCDRQGNENGARQTRNIESDPGSCNSPDCDLSLASDIDDTCPETDCDIDAGEDVRSAL